MIDRSRAAPNSPPSSLLVDAGRSYQWLEILRQERSAAATRAVGLVFFETGELRLVTQNVLALAIDGSRWPAIPADETDDDGDGTSECSGDCDDTNASVYPGAPQVCDGVNNDCSDPNWPAVPADETDDDVGFGELQRDHENYGDEFDEEQRVVHVDSNSDDGSSSSSDDSD